MFRLLLLIEVVLMLLASARNVATRSTETIDPGVAACFALCESGTEPIKNVGQCKRACRR